MADASPLAAFVDQWTQNQEMQMKKARATADASAEQWSRQFQVSQAKDKAAQQKITNDFEQERLRTDNFRALQDALKKQADITRDRDKIKISEDALDLKEKIHNRTLDANDFKALQKEILAKQKEYEKSYTPARAQEMAQELLNTVRQHIVENTAPQGAGAPQQQGATQPQGMFGSIDYLNSLGAQNQQGSAAHPHDVIPPSETPAGMNQLLPAAQGPLDQQAAKLQSEKALAKQRESVAYVNTITAEATKALKSAEATEHAQKAKIAEADAKTRMAKDKAEVQKIINEAAQAHSHTISMMENDRLNHQKFDLEKRKVEAELGTKQKAVTDKYEKKVDDWKKRQTEYQTDIGKTYKAMAELNAILAPGVMEGAKDTAGKPKYTPLDIQTYRKGAADQMAHQIAMQQSLRAKVDELEANIREVQPLIDKAKGRNITTPSGGKDPKAQKAHEAAQTAASKSADRKANASARKATPVFAPAPGTSSGGMRSVPAPKKKIEKKTIKTTPSRDLWKQLGQ